MRQTAGHFAPSLGTLGRNHVGHVVQHQQAFVVGQQGSTHHQRDRAWLGPVAAGGARHLVPFEGLLPMVVVVVVLVGQKGFKLLLHPTRKFCGPRHSVQ